MSTDCWLVRSFGDVSGESGVWGGSGVTIFWGPGPAISGPKPYEFLGFGGTQGSKPYKCIGFAWDRFVCPRRVSEIKAVYDFGDDPGSIRLCFDLLAP